MYTSFRQAAEEIVNALEDYGVRSSEDLKRRNQRVSLIEEALKVDTSHQLHRTDFLQRDMLVRILRRAVMTASLKATVELLYPRVWKVITTIVQGA